MIFEILYRRFNNKEVLITTINDSIARKIEVLSEFLSPEQQKSLITTTPVQKVAVLSPVKKFNIITKIV
jgi:hypothetical protein